MYRLNRRRSKYNAKKTVVDEIEFDSKKEAKRYKELKLLERSGAISNLELQPQFILQDKFKDRTGKTIRAIKYVADFKYFDNQEQSLVVEDVKGMKTDVYKLKKKIFLNKNRDIKFVEI